MINLALISHSPHLNGAERSLVSLAGLFHKNSSQIHPLARLFHKNSSQIHPILMIPIPENGEMSKVATNQGIEITYTPPNPWYIYKSPNNTDDFDLFCKTIYEHIEVYKELFITTNTNVVLVNTLTNFIPAIAAYKLGLPIITWVHGVLDPLIIPRIDPLYQKVVDIELLNLSDNVIYCSRWTEGYFEKFVNKKKSSLIRNWTSEPDIILPYNKSGKKFICLNSMEPKKGIDILVNACNILKDKGYDFNLEIYGIGSEYHNIVNQINYLELGDVVSIKARTTDIAKLYNECVALIQPSLYESFGRTTIEAMSYKRPVIAATTADPEHNILDEKSGFLVEAGNSEQLAEKMIYILENRRLAESMGIKGYKLFKAGLNGKVEKKQLTKLILELYNQHRKSIPEQQLAFEVLNLLHKGKLNQGEVIT